MGSLLLWAWVYAIARLAVKAAPARRPHVLLSRADPSTLWPVAHKETRHARAAP